MHKTFLIKIKEGKHQELLDWFRYLNKHPETEETLKEEQVNLEETFIFKINDQWYCLYHMFSNTEILPSTDRELNKQHKRKLRECLEDEPTQPLLGLFKTQ